MTQNDFSNPKTFIKSLLFLIFIVLFFSGKLFNLQILKNENYSSKTNETIYRRDIVQAERGLIYDRNYDKPLADNKEVYQIILDYQLFKEEDR